jgi:hypothetical protein
MLSFKVVWQVAIWDVAAAGRASIAVPKLRNNERKVMRPGLRDTAGKDHSDCSPAGARFLYVPEAPAVRFRNP